MGAKGKASERLRELEAVEAVSISSFRLMMPMGTCTASLSLLAGSLIYSYNNI